MIFLLEIKEGYSTDDLINILTQWGVNFHINNGDIIANLTFDNVTSLKDIAYCTHQCNK